MLSFCKALFSKPLFYKNLDGGVETPSFLIIFTFLILLLTPLNSLNSQTLQLNPDSIPFAPAVSYPALDQPISIFCADLDSNPGLDLAVANGLNDSVSILKNNGDGTFQSAVNYWVGSATNSVFCADLDGDNDLDLAVARASSDSVSVLINNGEGIFEFDSSYAVGDHPASVFCADLDDTLGLDLVTANELGDNISVLRNDGNGRFTIREDYPAGDEAYSVFCADLDDTLGLDLVVTNANSHDPSVSIFRNYGEETFPNRDTYPVENQPWYVFCADLDGDTDLDLALSIHYSNRFSILTNNGDGTFQLPASTYPVGDGPVGVFSADIDGDNDMDVVVTNRYSDNISIFTNNGSLTFERHDYAVMDGPYSVFCADLDGDMDLDIATANIDSDNISILLNLTNTRPDSFSLTSPMNNDSVKTPVTLIWQTSIDLDPNDTVRYDLYLSRSINFNLDTIVYHGLLDTTFRDSTDFTDSTDLKLWYWRVKAYDKWGAVRWSDQTWSFYVYLCGDCNGDGKINVADVVYAINYLFKGGPVLKPMASGDVNCDGKVTVADVVYTINYLFKGGPKPCKNCP